MKRIGCCILLLVLLCVALGCPILFSAVYLRCLPAPERVLERFYTEQDLAEDQLADALLLAGPKVASLLEREIQEQGAARAFLFSAAHWREAFVAAFFVCGGEGGF